MADKPALELKTYRWSGNSAIAQIDVRGDGVAYIHATTGASGLPQLREMLEKKGLATSSDIRNGDDSVLRVSGFGNVNDIIGLLQSANAIEGHPTVTVVESDHKSYGLAGLKANSLRASGIFYLLGDALYVMSGFARHDKDNQKIGMSMGFGDVVFMAFGGKDDKKEFSSLIKKLKKHYQENGIEIPQGSAIDVETMAKPGGFLERTFDFIHENVNPIKLMAEVIGGAFMIKAGYNQNNPGKKIAGSLIVTGWLAALLIKEKKYDPKEYDEAGTIKKAWLKLQSQPLQIAGYAGLANNAFNVYGSLNERKRRNDPLLHNGEPNKSYNQHWYRWDLGGTAAFIVANGLYSISKKTNGGDIKNDSIVSDIYGMSAQVLSHLDEDSRDIGIRQTSEFLGKRIEIKDTREQIEARLRREVSEMQRNPWFGTGHIGSRQPSSGPTL